MKFLHYGKDAQNKEIILTSFYLKIKVVYMYKIMPLYIRNKPTVCKLTDWNLGEINTNNAHRKLTRFTSRNDDKIF